MSEQKNITDSTIPNDRINIYGDIDVTIKKLKPLTDNEFRVELSGMSIDNSIVNAIRRTIMMNIPIYGFYRSNIFIEVEKSRNMYNNDMLYNQIEMLPIFDIPNYYDLENPEIFLPTDIMKNLFSKFIQERNDPELTDEEIKAVDANKQLFRIELSLNVKNNTGNDIFASTHDAVLKVNGAISDSYKRRKPISIIVLKPTEEISLRAEANLGIAKMYASYEATTNAILDEISSTKFHLWYETLEQLDKTTIFVKACTILSKKLEFLKKYLAQKFTEDLNNSEVIEIPIIGEEHTLGNLLATVLQKCEFVEKAAYKVPHPFIDEVIIIYKLFPKSKKTPIRVLQDCIEYLITVFQSISHNVLKK